MHFFNISTYFYHLVDVCVYLYISFSWKKCVKCFIPAGTHSRFTESLQAMQKLHFCNFRVEVDIPEDVFLSKKRKKPDSFILSENFVREYPEGILGALWTSLSEQHRLEQLTDCTIEESSRLNYELQLRVSTSLVGNKLLLLHIGKNRTLKPQVVATPESVLKHTDIISS